MEELWEEENGGQIEEKCIGHLKVETSFHMTL